MADLAGDFVPFGHDAEDVRQEAVRRSAKAGLTTKYGELPFATKAMTSVSWGRQKLNVWPRDSRGRLK